LFRPIVAAVIGFGAALIAKIIVSLIIMIIDFTISFRFAPNPVENPLTWAITLMLGCVLFLIGLFAPDGSGYDEDGIVLEVPETQKAGLLLWNGMPAPFGITIYLWTGKYPWIGRVLGFSLSDFASVNDDEADDAKQEAGEREPFTDGSFYNMGEVIFPVWNDAQAEKGSDDRKRILAPASNNATVVAAITLVLRTVNPRLLTDSTDPGRAVGDQARQELRELTINFVDTDLTKLHGDIDKVWLGTPLVTCFMSGSVAGLKPGSMIRNRAGRLLYVLAKDGDIQAAERDLKQLIVDTAPEKQRTAVMKNGEPQFTTVEVKHPISEALDTNGLKLVRVNFAQIDFSEAVKKASNEASSQEAERETQIASAKSAKVARKELQPDEDENFSELAMILGAALDPGNKGNVKLLDLRGGDRTAGAIIDSTSKGKDIT
jgi:hypothetical protein